MARVYIEVYGCSANMADSEIARVLGQQEPATAVQELVRLANEEGGTDNITVQIAAVPEEQSAEEKKKPKWLVWAVSLGILALLGSLLLGRL